MGQRSTERGNALLITLVVVTLIGVIGLSSAQLALSSLKRQARLEDSAAAYQVALAGIEDGLLRWRHNRDVEAPTGGTCIEAPTVRTNYVERVVLADGATVTTPCVDVLTSPRPDSATPTYDLKIWYMHPPGVLEDVRTVARSDGSSVPALKQDATVEYRLRDAARGSVRIGVRPSSLSSVNHVIDLLGLRGDVLVDKQPIRLPNADGYELNSDASTPSGVVQFTGEPDRLRLKFFGSDLARYAIYPGEGGQISSRYTTIESTGYYGGVKRRLVAQLDRFGNALYAPFDFVLFAGDGDITASE
jgi:hypothetical protein